MDQELEDICSVLLQRPEYQRKEVISVLIASMLTEMSDKEAKKTYDKLIKALRVELKLKI